MDWKRLFVPKWMKDPAATEKLTDERKLGKAALAGEGWRVRCAAVQKTGDLQLLRTIAADSKQDQDVRIDALKRLDDPALSLSVFLATRAELIRFRSEKSSPAGSVRLNACAFRGVRDMAAIRGFLTDKTKYRHEAIENMTVFDPEINALLQELIRDPKEDILVRKAAVKIMTDRDALMKILEDLTTAETEPATERKWERGRNGYELETTAELIGCLLEKTGDQSSCDRILRTYLSGTGYFWEIIRTYEAHSTNLGLLQSVYENKYIAMHELERQLLWLRINQLKKMH